MSTVFLGVQNSYKNLCAIRSLFVMDAAVDGLVPAHATHQSVVSWQVRDIQLFVTT